MKYLIFVLILFLTGCQTASVSENVEKTSSLPDWVTSPPSSGELVVSIIPANESSSDFQLKAAVLDARAQLARNRTTYIEDSFETSQKKYSENISNKSFGKQTSNLNLNFSKARIIDKFIAENGDLYLLYGFKTEY